ncbi:MAG: hypothetical protein Q9222_004635 [Ikaeria aurantiellina]
MIPTSDLAADGFQEVSYSRIANAINRLAWWLSKNFDKETDMETLGYLGPFDLRYVILTIAAQKAGYKAFFPSPRNGFEANLHLLDSADCKKFIKASDLPSAVFENVLEQREMVCKTMLSLESCLDPAEVNKFPYRKSFDQVRNDAFVALHTSGSTGLPKLVIPTQGTFAASDLYQCMPTLGFHETMVESIKGKRVFVGMPSFHAAGLFMIAAMTTYFGMVPVLGPPTTLTPELVNDVLTYADVQVACIPPVIIEGLMDDDAYRERLGTLECVMYGGGPLSKQVGDRLAENTSVVCLMGSTETMLLPTEIAGSSGRESEWQYFGFSPCMGADLRHLDDDLYRLFIVRKHEFASYQSVFYTFPDLQEYDTKDLYSKHPTKAGLWRYRGRCDDMIVLSTGENVNPLSMEGIINSHPEVASALMAGQGRRRTSLLIEPKEKYMSFEEKNNQWLDSIWPTIEDANKLCFAHGRISRDLVIFTSEEKPMRRAGKGTIQRRDTVKQYKMELDEAYDRYDRHHQHVSNGLNGESH